MTKKLNILFIKVLIYIHSHYLAFTLFHFVFEILAIRTNSAFVQAIVYILQSIVGIV